MRIKKFFGNKKRTWPFEFFLGRFEEILVKNNPFLGDLRSFEEENRNWGDLRRRGNPVYHQFFILLETVLYWIKEFNFNEFVQLSHDCAPENTRHIFAKICVKAIRDMRSPIREGAVGHEEKGRLSFLVGDRPGEHPAKGGTLYLNTQNWNSFLLTRINTKP